MKRHRRAGRVVFLALLLSLVVAWVVLGQSGGVYDLGWWTMGGGGGTSSSGTYVLTDTEGQSIASHDASDDGLRYALTDGFWQVFSTGSTIYVPVIVRGGP